MDLSNKLIVLFGLALATASSVFAEDTGYLRASAIDVFPKSHTSNNETGILIALGYENDLPGSGNSQQFELEIGRAKFHDVVFSGDSLTYVPILLTYRYKWNFNQRLSLAAGPSVGMSYAKGELTGFSDTDWVLSYGAGVQLNYRLSDVVSLTAGYRYLVNGDANFGGVVNVDDQDVHIVELGLRFDWPY